MRHPIRLALCLAGMAAIAGCDKGITDAEVERAVKSVNVIDESNLNDIMLTVGDPDEAVAYFRGASAQQPDRIDLQRGLAKSLVRANRPTEAAGVWVKITTGPEATNEDRVDYADTLIRANEWAKAEAELNAIPPTYETFQRYRLEAMVADSKKNWAKADSFYEIAQGMTTKPAGVLNNWGFSKLTRGDFPGAERLFVESITYDSSSFTAKNNLVLARGAQRKYDLPVVPMTQTERAQLQYTLALTAIKQGDVAVGKALLQQAIDTHPQYFEAAVNSLKALEGSATAL
jgi:Flp pilus assembly protein TadD